MSDINGAPHSEPVMNLDDNTGGSPATPDSGPTDFDRELEAFLGYKMSDDPGVDADVISTETKDNSALGTPVTAVPGAEAVLEPSASATKVAAPDAVGTGNLTAPTPVDPALVMEMLGMGKVAAPSPVTTVTASAAPAAAPISATPPAGDDAPFAPFRSDFQLPPQLVSQLFEAEDSDTRGKALVTLLSSAMNTVCQLVDKRVAEVHGPRFAQNFQRQQDAVQTQAAFVNEFYDDKSGYPDLRAHGPVVKRAIEVIAGIDPNVSWNDARPRVAALARAVVQQLTGQIAPAPVATAPPAPRTKANPQQHAAFLTGNGRPAGTGDPVDPNSPAGALADLTQF